MKRFFLAKRVRLPAFICLGVPSRPGAPARGGGFGHPVPRELPHIHLSKALYVSTTEFIFRDHASCSDGILFLWGFQFQPFFDRTIFLWAAYFLLIWPV